MYLQVTRGTIQRTYYPSAHRASYLGIRDTSNITHTPKNPPRPEVFRMCVWGLIRTTAAFYFATNKGRWGPLFKPGRPRHPFHMFSRNNRRMLGSNNELLHK